MEDLGYRYVVLRGYDRFDQGFPAYGAKEDVDLLVEDRAISAIKEKYGRFKKQSGVKCDVYDVGGGEGFLGASYFPQNLAESVLRNLRKWGDLFFVPSARDHLFSLIYHIAYQKAELSLLGVEQPAEVPSKYDDELRKLLLEQQVALPFSLMAFHEYLKREEYIIPYETLVKYLQNDFSKHRKSYFLAKVCDEQVGELNMFVIRKVAVQTQAQSALIEALASQYKILCVKDIPWYTRLTRSRKMRGGKWKRGGKPYIAVVVFDSHPEQPHEADRQVHPFVFNKRQFIKRELRTWFAEATGTRIKDNPLHSTDNEAEAVGHFPLFFTHEEQRKIFLDLSALRADLSASFHAVEMSPGV
jgi:hypothetical protein